MTKRFRPRPAGVAFAVLAVVSVVALTLGGNITPYAAEVPSAPHTAPVRPDPAGPDPGAPSSASPLSASPPSGSKRRTPPATPPSPVGDSRTTTTGPVSAIPPEAMLSASDLGAGVTGNEERVDDHGSLATMLAYCGQSPASWEKRVDSLGFRQRWLKYPDETYTVQEVSRQPSPVAAKLLADLRAVFGGPCATVPIGGNPDNVGTFTILDSDWGDESIIMHETRTEGGRPTWRIMVRQGDLITEIRIAVDGLTEQQARELGRRAAQRMCAATPTC